MGVLTAQKIAAIIRAKRSPHGNAQRTADNGDQKGEVNMTTPSVAELLVQQTEKAERLRLQLLTVKRLAKECKDLDEFRRELERLTEQ